MSYTAEDINGRWSRDGSIYSLNNIHPDEIPDPELSFFWGKAKDALRAFERTEDEIVRVLEHRHAKGWQE